MTKGFDKTIIYKPLHNLNFFQASFQKIKIDLYLIVK